MNTIPLLHPTLTGLPDALSELPTFASTTSRRTGHPSDPNHGVTFTLEVDWGSPLNVCTDIEVLDDAPQVFYVEGANSPAH